jgi:hypothetical protein
MEIKRVGWISDSEFEQMQAALIEGGRDHHPPQEMQLRIEAFDRDIENYLEDLNKDTVLAVNILMQGRNFAARLLGLEQRRAPREVVKMLRSITGEQAPVAIYCHNSTIFLTIKQVMEALKETLEALGKVSYVFCDDLDELADAALHGEISGIISVNLDSRGKLESSIRHDLKNRDGWDYQKAEAVELPPCRDLHAGPQILAKLMFTIQDMHELPAEQMRDPNMTADAFDLKEAIGNGIHKFRNMAALPATLTVAVCDDQPPEVEGLMVILRAWPDVEVHLHDSKDFKDDKELGLMTSKCDIVLLDENMGHITGRMMSEYYHQLGSTSPVVASISGGIVPWTKKHFKDKCKVMKVRVVALEFMHFMDHLLEERLRQRKLIKD